MNNQAAQTMPPVPEVLTERAKDLLSRMQKAKLNERGHWCDARAAVDAACDILPKLIAALSQTAGVPSLDEWERVSLELLAHGLRERGDDLSTDSASWLEKWLAAAPAAIATSKTDDRCTDPENCKRCSEDASTPHAGIPHAAPAESGGEAKPAFGKERPSSDEEAMYDAAAKGFHTSETSGTDGRYVHVIRFQSIEELHAYEHAWTAAMVKVRDSRD